MKGGQVVEINQDPEDKKEQPPVDPEEISRLLELLKPMDEEDLRELEELAANYGEENGPWETLKNRTDRE